jgi:segregation and condensation protein A
MATRPALGLDEDFDDAPARQGASDFEFSVDLDGYEGPLHLLLSLARAQKVDLRHLSILTLAEQYLAFIADARAARIDLAADYLVMASWLAYLKSRLLLPKQERPATSEAMEDIATHLAWRLARLDAMRRAANALYERPQTGLDVFVVGTPHTAMTTPQTVAQLDVWDLVRAYAKQRRNIHLTKHQVQQWPIYALDAARARLSELVKPDTDWSPLGQFAPPKAQFKTKVPAPASRYASLMAAGLELAKQGKLSMRQLDGDAPIYIRGVRHERS